MHNELTIVSDYFYEGEEQITICRNSGPNLLIIKDDQLFKCITIIQLTVQHMYI